MVNSDKMVLGIAVCRMSTSKGYFKVCVKESLMAEKKTLLWARL